MLFCCSVAVLLFFFVFLCVFGFVLIVLACFVDAVGVLLLFVLFCFAACVCLFCVRVLACFALSASFPSARCFPFVARFVIKKMFVFFVFL